MGKNGFFKGSHSWMNGESRVDFNLKLETDLYIAGDFQDIVPYTGVIQAIEDGEPVGELGRFRLTHIARYDADMMESYDGDYLDLDEAVSSLIDDEEEEPLSLWYLDRLVVKPECRGKGIGSQTVDRLIRFANTFSCVGSLFVVRAEPLNDEGEPLALEKEGFDIMTYQVRLERLFKLFSRLGLPFLPINPPIKTFNSSEPKPLWFYYDLEKNYPPSPFISIHSGFWN